MNKCLSRMKVPFLASVGAALLRFAFGVLHAGDIPPGPADTFFYLIPTTDAQGFAGSSTILALSGDGKAALVSTWAEANLADGVHHFTDEFILRDGKRTLLHHFDFDANSTGSGQWWSSIDLNSDGSSILAQKRGNGVIQWVILTFSTLTESPVPLPNPLRISGNARWAVGRGATNVLLYRTRLEDGFTDMTPTDLNGTNYGVSRVFGVSSTGTVCGTISFWPLATDRPFLWTSDGEFRRLPVPENFIPTASDEAGETLIGTVSDEPGFSSQPAYWTQQGGLVKLTTVLNGVDARSGNATRISGDGQLVFGTLSKGFTGQDAVVWTRNGSVYLLSELIRGVDLGDISSLRAVFVSRDGRIIAGTFMDSSDFYPRYFLAGLALPGEGPQLVLSSHTGGRWSLSFHTKSGFHYQVQSSTSLNTWDTVGSEMAGDDTDHVVSLPDATLGAGFFRVVVTP